MRKPFNTEKPCDICLYIKLGNPIGTTNSILFTISFFCKASPHYVISLISIKCLLSFHFRFLNQTFHFSSVFYCAKIG